MTTDEERAEATANERSRLDQVSKLAIRIENDTGLSLHTIGSWLMYLQLKRDQKDWAKCGLEDPGLSEYDRTMYKSYAIAVEVEDLHNAHDYGEDLLNSLCEVAMRYDLEGFTSPIIDQEVV